MTGDPDARPDEDTNPPADEAAAESREALVAEADRFLDLSGADVETSDHASPPADTEPGGR